MKFICKNENCERYGIEDNYTTVRYKLVDGHLQADCAPCPCCGQIREEINPNRDIPLSEKNIGIGVYSSASPEQRREMLKKRSHDHFEKEIKPFKEYQLHETINKFKEASRN